MSWAYRALAVVDLIILSVGLWLSIKVVRLMFADQN